MGLRLFQARIPLLVTFTILQMFVEKVRTGNAAGSALEQHSNDVEGLNSIKTKFSLRYGSKPDEDLCYIFPGHVDSLSKCGFNTTSKTFLIIHGWSVSGMFESWIEKLIIALYQREPDANILVVDWLDRAHQHYPIAAKNTMLVGQDIAKLINWLEKQENNLLNKMHLIGYSLGAHVAGFAGSHTANKISRITAFSEAVKCEHERSIHLFIDSLLYEDQPCKAYRCNNHKSFEKGMCLNCRKNRCNTLGYNVKWINSKKCNRMYLKTRANMPFRVYHYQLKIHFSNKFDHVDIDPTLSVSLHGTKNDVKDLPTEIVERFTPNKTHSFLVVTEVDIGDLLMIKFKWESSLTWNSLWKRMRSSIAWYKLPLWAPSITSNFDIHVDKIRVKCGETQKKMTFCLKDSSAGVSPSQEVTLVKCPASLKLTSTGSPHVHNH
ncbi:lipoprotein lipase-like isoform X2 [Scyliorhinus torazame]|uniref:lipoprotein lipase-like isoform X2 n=1 Tax=Scyliorhinus torazame TaxID=75743 RepID=UPI003B5A0BE4